MLRPFSKIRIHQVTPYTYKSADGTIKTVQRSKNLELDFVHSYEIEQGWETHTSNASIKFPKNVVLKSKDFLFKQAGTYNVLLGGSNPENYTNKNIEVSPLIMRGDLVEIEDGYIFKNEQRQDVTESTLRFTGYVSKIHSKIPIEIELEDNFYLLKRTPVNKSFFKGNLIDLCKYMLVQANKLFNENEVYSKGRNGNPYPNLQVDDTAEEVLLGQNAEKERFSLSNLVIGDVTCGELLSQLRKNYHIESFFIGNVLHIGMPIYDESRANSKNFFYFRDYIKDGKLIASANIFDDSDLEYKTKDDVQLSCVVSAVGIEKTGKKTRDGSDATKKAKVSILIYWDLASQSFKFHEKERGKSFPENEGGERHNIPYSYDIEKAPPSTDTLFKYGVEHLKKYQYNGFKGSFSTFGFPFVNWNDNVNLIDPVLLDRNGQYKVKKVKYRGGVNGLSQEIFLDFRQEVKMPGLAKKIFMI